MLMNHNIANYMANIKSQITESTVEQLQKALTGDALVIDVREPQEHAQGIVPGAVAIARGVLEFNIFNLPALQALNDNQVLEKPIYIYCASGGRSACAAHSLQQIGFKQVYSVAGGIKAWTEMGGKLAAP
jgi:rhodanese-related sulfurtransferase